MKPALRFQALLLAVVLLAGIETVRAQGRNLGAAVKERTGAYFVDVKLPAPSKLPPDADHLASIPEIVQAASEGHLSFLYVYDPTVNAIKHKHVEKVLFKHENFCVTLLYFKCFRVDISQDGRALERYGKLTPFFVAFDDKGKRVGEYALMNYTAKFKLTPMDYMLARAAKGHAKLSLASFIKDYRSFLNSLRVLNGHKKVLSAKKSRLKKSPGPRTDPKLAEVEKQEEALLEQEVKLFEMEEELLKKANIPPRDPRAKHLGGTR